MIDLIKWERELLEQKRRGVSLRPVPTTFSRLGGVDRIERALLRANRRQAQHIYQRIKDQSND